MEFERKLLNEGYLRYVGHWGDDLSPLEAARMSTSNPTGLDEAKDDGLRDYLYRNQHSSPFEFAELVVEVQLPIFVQNQWVRHRTFSFNSFSGRYAEMPELFYEPESDRVQGAHRHNKQGSGEPLNCGIVENFLSDLTSSQTMVYEEYRTYLDQGVAGELARINLPLAQFTRMRVKGNLRNWLNFLRLRLDEHAQLEIRVYAQAVAELIKQLWPKTWETFEEHTLGAVTFSRTEMELLRMYLWDLSVLLNCEPEEMFKEPAPVVLEKLGKSRAREFLEKLGV